MSSKSKSKRSSNRSFGLLFFLVFVIISFWPLLNEGPVRIWSIVIAIILNDKLEYESLLYECDALEYAPEGVSSTVDSSLRDRALAWADAMLEGAK